MLELHFSVAGYGGLRLPFRGITEYLRGLVSVYERPIMAGVRILIVSSTTQRMHLKILISKHWWCSACASWFTKDQEGCKLYWASGNKVLDTFSTIQYTVGAGC